MENVILVIHLLVAIALILLILIQRTAQDGGGLASGSTMGGMFTARGSANMLTRTTAILATIFIATSLILTIMAGSGSASRGNIILDAPAAPAPAVPAQNKTGEPPNVTETPAPVQPVAPQVPMAK